ncbi:hypothetical protein MGALJ_09750 [Mycobacterium gallinarum]|uniref:DNA-binding phage zinc finger domain-containing protein n=1 Tax=Mycobacterium gallinarum TaxID=39689 RepID=A0A9W4AZK3_9MYCO|nr:hypothetical protein [Mycobacterium gallinarum]BBY91306.1 hypothetical protein MGALJ_09750 [Mycobacterium gallinarum]
MTSQVFVEVYTDAAMDRECPNCQAPPHRWCKRPNGETRPIPCIARMRIAPSPPDVEHQAVLAHLTRSFSEPIHQPDNTEE